MSTRNDNCNRADTSGTLGTPSDGGGGYTISGSGTYEINSNEAKYNNASEANATLEASTANVELTAEYRAGGNQAWGLAARCSDNNNKLVLERANSTTVRFWKVSGGSYTNQHDYTTSIGVGDTLSIRCNGDTISVKKNGTVVNDTLGNPSFTETHNNTVTNHGMRSFGSGGRWDNLSIEDLAGSLSVAQAKVLTEQSSIALNLTGSGVSWTPGTPGSPTFTATGVSGVSVVSQVVHTSTTATVTIETTGASTGTLNVSDGAVSDTVDVTATATSAQAGDADVAATWDVNAVPTSAHHISVGHNVNIPDSRQYTNLTITAGILTIETGATLRKTGTGTWSGGTLRLEGTAIFNIDGGTTMGFGTGASQSCKLQTTGDGWKIQTTPGTTGSGRAYFADGGHLDSQELDIQGTGTIDLGTEASNNALVVNSNTAAKNHTVNGVRMPNGSGDIKFASSIGSNVGLTVTNCTFESNHASAYGLYVQAGAGPSSVPRVITGNVFFATPRLPAHTLTCDDNKFLREGFTATGSAAFASFKRNLIRGKLLASLPRWGHWGTSITNPTSAQALADGNTMFTEDATLEADGTYTPNAGYTNPHWTTPDNGNVPGLYKLYGTVFESFRALGTDSYGDIDYTPTESGAGIFDTDARYNIVVPDHGVQMDMSDLRNPGTMTTHNGIAGDNLSSIYEHNTFFNGQQGFAAILEGNGAGPPYGAAGQIASIRSNCVWNLASLSSGAFNYITYLPTIADPANVVEDYVTAMGNNHCWNIRTDGADGSYYDTLQSYTPANDTDGDPQFFDYTRHFAKWVQSIESSWTGVPSPTIDQYRGRGLYKISLVNQPAHADFDARYTVLAYRTYEATGFAPQNTALRNAGHDGATKGAVEMSPKPSGRPGLKSGGNLNAVGILTGGAM